MQIEFRHDRTRNETLPPKPLIHAEPLTPDYRAKPWGRRDGIPAHDDAQPLGEVVFDAAQAGLVIKWLQTSEPLSIQVHPRRGPGRKHEWWYVADARPGAYLHLGLKHPATREEIRRAAEDGALPQMLRRIEPAVGDTFFVEAGAIHALGPGLTVVEVQEPSDVTWRLYDYGRPRELHLEQGLREAILDPRPLTPEPGASAPFRVALETLAPDQHVTLAAPRAGVAVAQGGGAFGGRRYEPHQCWEFAGSLPIHAAEPTVLIVAEPREPRMEGDALWRARQ